MTLSRIIIGDVPLNDPALHFLGWLFLITGITLIGVLLNGLRTGRLRHQFKSMSEVREQYFGKEQTTAERLRSEREGGPAWMPVIGFLASLVTILGGLLFLGVIPLIR
jgi:hypothetical protein